MYNSYLVTELRLFNENYINNVLALVLTSKYEINKLSSFFVYFLKHFCF